MAPSRKNSEIIEIVHPICCGLDVHKESVTACLLYPDEAGREDSEIRVFETFLDSLQQLKEWLLEKECPIVAMESTGVYWRPVHNVLEGAVQVLLVNPGHMRNVPGRKTDVSDSQWLAGLLRHGLVRGSFIPPREVREWRELVRARRKLTGMRGDLKKRVEKVFETANVKLDCVVSDLFGVTGRELIDRLRHSSHPLSRAEIRACIHGRLRRKEKELERSLASFFTEHHRVLLGIWMRMIETVEEEIRQLDERLSTLLKPHQDLLERLDEIPGVDQIAGQGIVAELGVTLEMFPTEGHLASWSGLCPGNNESAGKRHSGRNAVRRHPLRTLLVEVAWAAIKKKGSYYREKYYRLRSRVGPKKAIVAIAHRLLKAIYFIIKEGKRFQDLGEDYLREKNRAAQLLHLEQRAKQFGYTLQPLSE